MPIFHRHDNKTHDLSTRFIYAALQVKNEFLDLVVTELYELRLSVAIWTNRSTIIVAPPNNIHSNDYASNGRISEEWLKYTNAASYRATDDKSPAVRRRIRVKSCENVLFSQNPRTARILIEN
jgi:hypothetical protein